MGENHLILFLYYNQIALYRFTSTNSKEATTPYIYQHQLGGGYNPLKHRNQPMDRTPILSEMQLTLAPPFHPQHHQAPTCSLKAPIFPSTTLPPSTKAPTWLFSSTNLKETLIPRFCTTLQPLTTSHILFFLILLFLYLYHICLVPILILLPLLSSYSYDHCLHASLTSCFYIYAQAFTYLPFVHTFIPNSCIHLMVKFPSL